MLPRADVVDRTLVDLGELGDAEVSGGVAHGRLGADAPRLDPAARRSRTSAFMSVAARSAAERSAGMLTSRGMPEPGDASGAPDASQILTAPWRAAARGRRRALRAS